MPKWSKLPALAAVAIAVCAGTGAAQADGTTAATSGGPVQAVAAQGMYTPLLQWRRERNQALCVATNGFPWNQRVTNTFQYHVHFVPYEPGEDARMSAWVERLEGSPRNMRRCPANPNMNGRWETERHQGDRGNIEIHWRQHSDAARNRWPSHGVSQLSLLRLTERRPLWPGVYRIVLRVRNFGKQATVRVPFTVMSLDPRDGPRG